MGKMNRMFHRAAASAERCAEAFNACSSSRRSLIMLDAILVASISIILALGLLAEILEILAVCLLVKKGREKRLKAVKPVFGM